tara:strand:- start:308 stop:478 length:171 start_codon:yes stop_codon:yes gene_type:complete
MKDLNGNPANVAYKVIATGEKEPVAEFIFKSLKEALAFEMGMRDKKYETTLERINV